MDLEITRTISGEFPAALGRRVGPLLGVCAHLQGESRVALGQVQQLLYCSRTEPIRAGWANLLLVFQEGFGGDLGGGTQPATAPDLSALMWWHWGAVGQGWGGH